MAEGRKRQKDSSGRRTPAAEGRQWQKDASGRRTPVAKGIGAGRDNRKNMNATLKKISVMHVIKLGFAPVSFPPG